MHSASPCSGGGTSIGPARAALRDLAAISGLAVDAMASAAAEPHGYGRQRAAVVRQRLLLAHQRAKQHGDFALPIIERSSSCDFASALSAVASGSLGLDEQDLGLLLQTMSRMERRRQASTHRHHRRSIACQSGGLVFGDESASTAGLFSQPTELPDAEWWLRVLTPPLSSMSLTGHAKVLEYIAGSGETVPEQALEAWGAALDCQDRRRRAAGGDGATEDGGDGMAVASAAQVVRLIVAFSRVGRRPPHSSLNALLDAMREGLPLLPVRHLVACLRALTRLRYVPAGPASSWMAACLATCAARAAEFDRRQALTVLRAMAEADSSTWSRWHGHADQSKALLSSAAALPRWREALLLGMPGGGRRSACDVSSPSSVGRKRLRLSLPPGGFTVRPRMR